MGHIAVSGLAFAHPSGELLFSDVSFAIAPGKHVGLVGANGVGKSTLLKILTGALRPDDGDASLGGIVAYMAQDVGAADDRRTVRELLMSLAGPAPRGGARRGRRRRRREARHRDRRLVFARRV